MSEHLKKRLKQKGWSKKDIDKAVSIFNTAKKKQTIHHKISLHASLVTTLLLVIVGNAMIATLLIPLMLALPTEMLFFILILLAFSMGLLFENITRTLEHVTHHHHILISLVVPAMAFLSFFLIGSYTQFIIEPIATYQHDINFLAAIYTLFLWLPYAYHKFIFRKHYYSG